MTMHSIIKKVLFLSFLLGNILFLDILRVEANNDIFFPSKVVGRIEGVGTRFELKDSDNVNFSLESSITIKLKMESLPKMISMMIESASSQTFSSITINGFDPLTTYYKYQDNYHNSVEFSADEKGNYSYLQDLSEPHFVFIQSRKGTKFIKNNATGGDCTLIGLWDSFSKQCTLTADLFESIQIDDDDIIIDGDNRRLIGNNSGNGVYLYQRNGVTIKNFNIEGFVNGIQLSFSNNNVVTGNTYLNNSRGVSILNSNNNIIDNNIINSNLYEGIYLQSSKDNNISNNSASKNSIGIHLIGSLFDGSSGNIVKGNNANLNKSGIILNHGAYQSTIVDNKTNFNSDFGIAIHGLKTFIRNNTMSNNRYNFHFIPSLDFDIDTNIDTSNLVDGKAIYFLNNVSNTIYDGSMNIGVFYCINCDTIIIKDLLFTNNGVGIFFGNTRNSKIENIITNNNIYGLFLVSSNNNFIVNNNSLENNGGIILVNSNHNTASKNLAQSNYNQGGSFYSGIYLTNSHHNKLSENMASNNNFGIKLSFSNSNLIIENEMSSNNSGPLIFHYSGIYLDNSSDNTLSKNTMNFNERYGVYLTKSVRNVIVDNIINQGRYFSYGIYFSFSGNNTAFRNTISQSANNEINGIYFEWANINTIYNNNFVYNPAGNIGSGSGNIFNLDFPIGGNYWSSFDTSIEGCIDVNNDRFCDASYVLSAGEDKLAWVKQNDWLVPADTISPDTNITSSIDSDGNIVVNGSSISSTSITFRFNGADIITPVDQLTFDCSLDNSVFTSCPISKTYINLSIGNHIFQVRAKDAAGNVDSTPATFIWIIVKTPVLLLSGIFGSWTKDADQLLNSSNSPQPNEMVLIEDQSKYSNRPVLGRYNSFIPETWKGLRDRLLGTEGGYENEKNLFAASYDWRKSNDFNRDSQGNLDLLRTYVRYPNISWDSQENLSRIDTTPEYLMYWIDRAKATSNLNKVDIIAHSMGGLVARSYIQSPLYQNDIRKLAVVGTPNHGAADSYPFWAGANTRLGQDVWTGTFLTTWFKQMKEHFGKSLTDVSFVNQFLTSVGQLLPVNKFSTEDINNNKVLDSGEDKNNNNLIDFFPGYLLKTFVFPPPIFGTFFDLLIPYNQLHQINQNDFLKNLNNNANFIKDKGIDFKVFLSNNLQTAKFVRVNQDPNPFDDKWIDGEATSIDASPEGDERVLFSSGKIIEIDPNDEKLVKRNDLQHKYLPSDFSSEIMNFLLNTNFNPVIFPLETKAARVLSIAIASPVDLLLIDPQGRRIGFDQITQTEFNEVPLGWYIGNIQNEHIVIADPLQGDYQVLLQGNASGSFKTFATIVCQSNPDISADQINIGLVEPGKSVPFTLHIKGGCDENAFDYTLNVLVDIKQDKMNIVPLGDKSNAHIDAFIELPALFDIRDINQETILLNNKVKPFRVQITDFNDNGISDLRVRFFKTKLQDIISVGDNQLTVSGSLKDGTRFKGSDKIRVIDNRAAESSANSIYWLLSFIGGGLFLRRLIILLV